MRRYALLLILLLVVIAPAVQARDEEVPTLIATNPSNADLQETATPTSSTNEPRYEISDLAWSPDGTRIAIGISILGFVPRCVGDANIHLMDAASKQMNDIPQTDGGCSMTNVDFSSEGSRLLVTSDSSLEIWDITTRQRLQSLIMEGNLFEYAFWDTDASTVLTVSKIGIDIISAVDLSKVEQRFIAPRHFENSFFTNGVWSPDGSMIASSTDDGRIYIWEAANAKMLRIFTAHTDPVQKLAWSKANNLIASGDENGRILVGIQPAGRQLLN
jgi:WD40 repeat protein